MGPVIIGQGPEPLPVHYWASRPNNKRSLVCSRKPRCYTYVLSPPDLPKGEGGES